MNRLLRAATTAAVALALCSPAGAAVAESASTPDTVGDAPPALDITRLTVVNAQKAVTANIRFRDLDASRIGRIGVLVDVAKPLGFGYFIRFKRNPQGGFTGRLEWAPLYSESLNLVIPCEGLRLTFEDSRARIRLPRTCMVKRHDERVRVAAFVENRRHTAGDSAPDGRLFGPWVRRG